MTAITRQALRVYSSLTTLAGSGGDVLDALVPFFDPVLSLLDNKYFDPHVFASGVRKLYGWRFTGDIAARFIPKLERIGYLERVVSSGQEAAWIVCYKPDTTTKDSGVARTLEEIIDIFETFPAVVSDLLFYSRSREELKDILIRFLVSMDALGQGAFAPELGNLEPSGEAQNLINQLEEGADHSNQTIDTSARVLLDFL